MNRWSLFLQLLFLAVIPYTVLSQDDGGAAQPDSNPVVDPEAEEIDQEAFREMFLLSGEEVARMVAEADTLEEDEDSVVDVIPGTGTLIPRPNPLKCENGPVRTIWRRPGYWYFPPIRVTRCRRLPCPNNAPCLARKTVTRDVWAICFKRFNCWGLILWIPIGIQRLCVIDESECECQKCSDIKDFCSCVSRQPCPEEENVASFCYWKPFKIPDKNKLGSLLALSSQATTDQIAHSVVDPCLWGSCDCCRVRQCPFNQFFDRRICMCRCLPSIICPRPFIINPDTCQCICPRTNNCGPHRRWNPVTCRCECKRFFCFWPRIPNLERCQCECPFRNCTPPFVQDPNSCECVCPKFLTCPPTHFLNADTCECQCLPILCAPGFVQDPDTCECVCDRECPPGFTLDPTTCQCVCKRECPPGSMLDPDTCYCINECRNITSEDICDISSCVNSPAHRCRWFRDATDPDGFCECECCRKANPAVSIDCGAISPTGRLRCLQAVDLSTGIAPACSWTCP